MFNIQPLDETPIYEVVRTEKIYLQGGHLLGPNTAWRDFASEVKKSLVSLNEARLTDDDQTLLLMSYRRNPDRYIARQVHPRDWFVIFKNFRSGQPIASVTFPTLSPGKLWRRQFRKKLRLILAKAGSK
jgi:hypothetical protein